MLHFLHRGWCAHTSLPALSPSAAHGKMRGMADTSILEAVPPFQVGDTLTVYAAPQPGTPVPAHTQPTSSSVTTGTIGDDGSVDFTGLTADAWYVAGKLMTVDGVANVWVQILFRCEV